MLNSKIRVQSDDTNNFASVYHFQKGKPTKRLMRVLLVLSVALLVASVFSARGVDTSIFGFVRMKKFSRVIPYPDLNTDAKAQILIIGVVSKTMVTRLQSLRLGFVCLASM